ncbi:MAG: selenocysteine-specific translation factor, partial [Nitrospiraceae bacterium]|nr:selenocysteine-specific translation factor [Nitrospiraceae bacterium]
GFGTVVTGTSISGQIGSGDGVSIYPKGIIAKIRGIQSHGQDIHEAQPGMRTALNLQGIAREQIKRGDVIATPGSLHPSCLLDLEFLYLASAGRPLKHRSPVRFHVGTTEITGRVLLQGMEISPGSKSYIQIRLERPVAVLSRDRYVMRSYSPIRTIGGGMILNPVPRKRKRTRPKLWKEIELLAKGGPSDIIEYHLRQAGVRGLTEAEVAMRATVYGKKLIQELEHLLKFERIIGLKGGEKRFVHRKVYEALKGQAETILRDFHRDNPLVQGLAKEELRSRLFPMLRDQKLFQRLLSDLVASGKILQEKNLVQLSNHQVALGREEKEIRERLEYTFKQAGLQPPSRRDAMALMEGRETVAGRIFDLMIREKVLIPLKGGLYYHHSTLDRVKDMVCSFIEREGGLEIKDFRDLTGGLSRKYMIPLLDYLDSQRVTIRIGDRRVLRQ